MSNFFNLHLNLNMKFKYLSLCLFLIIFSNNTAQNCPPQSVVATKIVSSGENLTYQASQTVNVAQGTNTFTILNGGKATFKAGTEITFYDGFDAFQGSELNTSLEICSIVNPLIPNDPLFGLQWGHRNLGNVPAYNNQGVTGIVGMDSKVLEAWTITQGSNNIIVAVVDSGLDLLHPDIDINRIYEPYNVINDSNDIADIYGHGTAVTGIIGAKSNNGIGIAGIDQNCRIMPIKISDDSILQVNLAKGINKAVEKGARIINLSLGSELPSSPEVQNAIANAINNNVIIIAASGNKDTTVVDYPSRYKEVISVGSANPSGLRKVKVSRNQPGNHDKDYRTVVGISLDFDKYGWGSNSGGNLDILAPGCLIPTTDVTGQDKGLSRFIGLLSNNVEQIPLYNSVDNGNYVKDILGTSFASPFATGVASLMLAVNPNLKPYDVDYILKQSATDTKDGYKLINAYEAVKEAQNYISNLAIVDWAVWIEAPQFVMSNLPPEINIVVKNNGTTVLPATNLTYEIKRIDNSINSSNSIQVGSLDINEQRSFKITLPSIQNTNANCSYNLIDSIKVKLNNTIKINEYSLLNNTFSAVSSYLPDLEVNNLVVNNTNGVKTISYAIKNIGNSRVTSPSLPFSTRISGIYKSDDNVLDSSDEFVENDNIFYSLCKDASTSTFFHNISQVNKPYIIIKADPFNEILESNENNNIVVVPINTTISNDGPIDLPIDPIPIDPISIEIMRNSNSNKENEVASFEIFPNPAKDYFSISYDSNTYKKVKVMDVLGNIKFEKELDNTNQINIESSSFSSGVYLIQLIDINNSISIKKLIKH
ncbi:S8 family serine peptidase [Flavobacterium sp. HNIBRBA15423]|uniref:S8 family serine peptidase n=1 Tax=Flavobacterium sp. HNIBRBA15423 TaxID=3458683 RepID=UPI00404414BB